MSAVGGAVIGSLLPPVQGCQHCEELARAHADAEAQFDRSAAVDQRVLMRQHQWRRHRS